ncbi:MAG: MTAP family purine nucleoside phosphorylase [Methanosarcinaceae archaeon]|nr:MTAP family purine nucleoside phosphorylase [Methanosarcinaceae archaeon]
MTFDIKAVIFGGVGFSIAKDYHSRMISTPYGDVTAYITRMNGCGVAIIPRHTGAEEHTPPHMINYRANVWAVRELGTKRIISTNSVGTMKDHPIGSFVLLDDFVDFTKNRTSTFFDSETVHVDMVEPYCPQIKKCMADSLERKGIDCSEGIYVCTEGPRFETRAEINMMKQFGDVVGMTGVPEVILAKELELCYASICTVTNYACGLRDGKLKLTVDEVVDVLRGAQGALIGVIADTVSNLPDDGERDCACGDATVGARV